MGGRRASRGNCKGGGGGQCLRVNKPQMTPWKVDNNGAQGFVFEEREASLHGTLGSCVGTRGAQTQGHEPCPKSTTYKEQQQGNRSRQFCANPKEIGMQPGLSCRARGLLVVMAAAPQDPTQAAADQCRGRNTEG